MGMTVQHKSVVVRTQNLRFPNKNIIMRTPSLSTSYQQIVFSVPFEAPPRDKDGRYILDPSGNIYIAVSYELTSYTKDQYRTTPETSSGPKEVSQNRRQQKMYKARKRGVNPQCKKQRSKSKGSVDDESKKEEQEVL